MGPWTCINLMKNRNLNGRMVYAYKNNIWSGITILNEKRKLFICKIHRSVDMYKFYEK